jgi:Glutathione S-transferase, N-terminal domain
MSGTLYGVVLSPNFTRAYIVAKYLGIDLKHSFVNLVAGEHKAEPFISINVCLFFFSIFTPTFSDFLLPSHLEQSLHTFPMMV